MYPDPKRVRIHRYNVRFDQYEHDYLQSLANLIGVSPATLIRQLALKQALADLTLEPQLMTITATNPDDKQTL